TATHRLRPAFPTRRSSDLEVHEHTDARALSADVLVIACGAASPQLRPGLPVRALCRQLVDVGPVRGLPADLPMTIEEESGFHFRSEEHTSELQSQYDLVCR